jgi:uncharacterized membrane-anchored protein YitT (DUF2179 family)
MEAAREWIMHRLENELPPDLTYHNARHTKAVTEIAERLAIAENLSDADQLLVVTAALFHDAGFLTTYKDHEEASCAIAKEALPSFGYSPDQVHTICRVIMATKLPQRANGKLEQVICDADLHYLGTENFFSGAENLFSEFKKYRLLKSKKEWMQKQLRFLKAHRFFTGSAQKTYNHTKQININLLSSTHSKNSRVYSSVQDTLFILLGVLIAGFALKGFLVPNHFFDGGVTGISMLVHELYHFNLAYVIIAFNLPFIIAGYFSVSKSFAVKTTISVILLGICLLFIPYPTITSDKLLISIFGGVFLGIGIGLTMRAGCALDGIEVLALYTLKRTSFTISEIILGINILIFLVAAIRFGMETALYSILTYFAASRMIDYVIEGIQAYTGVTIISSESETIKYRLVNELGRGITVYKGERGFLPGQFEVSADCDIIFTVVTRLELRKLKTLVYQADPKAFVFANTIKEASGGVLKRRQAH